MAGHGDSDLKNSGKTVRIDNIPTSELNQKPPEPAPVNPGATGKIWQGFTASVTRFFPDGLLDFLTTSELDKAEGIYDHDGSEALSVEDIDHASDEISGLRDVGEDFELNREIAVGGQGKVSRAKDLKFGRVVAVKSLHETHKGEARFRRAFIAEAKISAQLEHPSIVPVYGIYRDAGDGLHLAMKLVHGKTLKRYLEKLNGRYEKMSRRAVRINERLLLKQRLDFFIRVCEAIAYVHDKNVIHRDLKPENIMIGAHSETYVMDWGVAEYRKNDASASDNSRLQAGTVQYIAPEIINRKPYDERSDIFLLGLILYELVFLKPAYPADSFEEMVKRARRGRYDEMSHRFGCRIDYDLRKIIEKSLAFEPERRYATAAMLRDDVSAYLHSEIVSANPHRACALMLSWFRRHYKLLIVALLAVMVLASFACAMFFYREVQKEMLQKKRDIALADVYSQGVLSGSEFDRTLLKFENQVSGVAQEAGTRLSMPPEKHDGDTVYSYLNEPDFMVDSPSYGQRISLEHFVYKPSVDAVPDADRILQQLLPMRDRFLAALCSSMDEADRSIANKDVIKGLILYHRKPQFGWAYVGLNNGIHISYPYHSDYQSDYDPRMRPWYIDAVEVPGDAAVWGEPYIDNGAHPQLVITCSKKVIDAAGNFRGVAGIDVSLSHLVKMLTSAGNEQDFVKNKYLVNRKGHVLADSADELVPVMDDGKTLFRSFPDHAMLADMWQRHDGVSFFTENGREYLYFFLRIETLNWLYIEKIDVEELLKTFKYDEIDYLQNAAEPKGEVRK